MIEHFPSMHEVPSSKSNTDNEKKREQNVSVTEREDLLGIGMNLYGGDIEANT